MDLLWEILTSERIFEPKLNQPSIDRDREQLQLMETYLGKINKDEDYSFSYQTIRLDHTFL